MQQRMFQKAGRLNKHTGKIERTGDKAILEVLGTVMKKVEQSQRRKAVM